MSTIRSCGICFECGAELFPSTEPYTVQLPDGDSFVMPSLEIYRCGQCAAVEIPSASSEQIELAIDKYTDSLSVEFLDEFLTQFGLDQTTAAQALGLGGKTIHRWLRGTQRISRSMGYFLRAMKQFPEAFHWVRIRGWQHNEDGRNAPAATLQNESVAQRFPATARRSPRQSWRESVSRERIPAALKQRGRSA